MSDKDNIEKNNKKDIKKIYDEFYKDLFTPNITENEMEHGRTMAEPIIDLYNILGAHEAKLQ